jgi:hypothetical protein
MQFALASLILHIRALDAPKPARPSKKLRPWN